ncbi:allatostatin-A receptor-like [Haliotis cracherodii]|uniref:allatostatin-A receptor-like n=1 Tax=Haliotis cracherodii TaxID=6455 RepID=UPI0039EA5D0C
MAECRVIIVVVVVMLEAVVGLTTDGHIQTTSSPGVQHVTTASRLQGSSTTQDLGSGAGLDNASTGSTPVKCNVGGSPTGNNASNACVDDPSDDPSNNTDAINSNVVMCKEEGEEGNITICKTTNTKRVSVISLGSLSKANYIIAEEICRYIYYPLLASAVLLNTFNIMVYTAPAMRSPTSTYLIALATDELLFACLSTLRSALKSVYGVDAVKKQLYLTFAMYVSNFVLASLRVLMYCLTVLVSLERFLAVAFPLKSRSFRLIKSPLIFIVAMSAICFLCHLPGAFKYNVVPKPNSTDYTIKPSVMFINNRDLLLGIGAANKILFTYIVLACGLIMNLCVLLALRKHSRNRQKMNTTVDAEKAAKRERQTTITILTSTFLFTVLALPLATDSMVQAFVVDYNVFKKEHYVNMLMKEVNGLLIMFSLSTDFVFYIALSRAYRRTFFRRLPFMATICRRQQYVQKSFGTQSQTQVSTVSETCSKDS